MTNFVDKTDKLKLHFWDDRSGLDISIVIDIAQSFELFGVSFPQQQKSKHLLFSTKSHATQIKKDKEANISLGPHQRPHCFLC